MKRVININQAKKLLLEREVLVYKPYNQQVTYLVVKDERRVTKFNNNVRYNISFEEVEEILSNNNVYLFEKDNQVEINQEFKKLIQ
jgi:hypothetical protein